MGAADFSFEELGWIKKSRFALDTVAVHDFRMDQLIGCLHLPREIEDEMP
jgi:hypothetical protein